MFPMDEKLVIIGVLTEAKKETLTAEDAKDTEEKQGQNKCLVKETQGIVGMRNKIGRLTGHPWSSDEGARKKRSPRRTPRKVEKKVIARSWYFSGR
jgi:hypothetical protein